MFLLQKGREKFSNCRTFGSFMILCSKFNTNPCNCIYCFYGDSLSSFYSKHPSQNWRKFMYASPPSCKKWNKESHLLIDVLMNNDVICYMISVHTKNITFFTLDFFLHEWMNEAGVKLWLEIVWKNYKYAKAWSYATHKSLNLLVTFIYLYRTHFYNLS